MLLGGINIPGALLTAHEEGELVIFTGAGVSIAAPSDLPSFLGLAGQVAAKLQSSEDPNSEEWTPQLDAFMGNLDDDEKVNVHRLVKGIVTAPTSMPNANHHALARIAAKKTARVVTTNYDLHLEQTLRERLDDDLEVFRAPAVPLGDNFEGLVYLHGSADSEPGRLVVTDRDFSKAYFHSAWAARFLERMVSEYVVLFVGYSP
jgi:NAD-dependent SIR2 family protein deacetylase